MEPFLAGKFALGLSSLYLCLFLFLRIITITRPLPNLPSTSPPSPYCMRVVFLSTMGSVGRGTGERGEDLRIPSVEFKRRRRRRTTTVESAGIKRSRRKRRRKRMAHKIKSTKLQHQNSGQCRRASSTTDRKTRREEEEEKEDKCVLGLSSLYLCLFLFLRIITITRPLPNLPSTSPPSPYCMRVVFLLFSSLFQENEERT